MHSTQTIDQQSCLISLHWHFVDSNGSQAPRKRHATISKSCGQKVSSSLLTLLPCMLHPYSLANLRAIVSWRRYRVFWKYIFDKTVTWQFGWRTCSNTDTWVCYLYPELRTSHWTSLQDLSWYCMLKTALTCHSWSVHQSFFGLALSWLQPYVKTLVLASQLNCSGFLLQLLEELRQAASAAKKPGTVWMITVAGHHLKELEAMNSPCYKVFLKWQQTKRFQQLESSLASPDLVLNAVSSLTYKKASHSCKTCATQSNRTLKKQHCKKKTITFVSMQHHNRIASRRAQSQFVRMSHCKPLIADIARQFQPC